MKLHHYGFATNSIESSVKEFEKIGYKPITEKIIDERQNVALLFISNGDNHFVELVAPLEVESSPITKILKKNGSSLYHICYEVDDMEKTIIYLKAKRFVVVLKPTPAVAFNNKRISFLYNAYTGLIEILEK